MTETVRREIVLPEEPAEVWEALTEPERLEEWFANTVELDLERGEGVFRWDDGSERHARIDVCDPERRFGFTWADEDGGETRVDFTLIPEEDGTRVVVVEQTMEWSFALEARAGALSRNTGSSLARDHGARESSLAHDQGVLCRTFSTR